MMHEAHNNIFHSLETAKTQWLFTLMAIAAGLLFAVFVYEVTIQKAVFLFIGIFFFLLIFFSPELGLVTAFSSGIFKEWLSTHVSIFEQFDFTVFIFGLTFLSILFLFMRRGILFKISIHYSVYPFILFAVFLILSILYTPSFEYGSAKALSFIVFNSSLFLFPMLILQSEKQFWKLTGILVAIGTLTSFYTIGSLISGLMRQNLLYAFRASFLGVNPISFAGWAGVINILWISLLPVVKGNKNKALAIIPIIPLTVAIVVANSRGPLVSFIMTLLIILAIRIRTISWRKLLISILAFVLLLLILFQFLPEQLTSRYTEIFQGTQNQNVMTFYTVNTRLHAWQTAFRTAVQSVSHFLVGIGSGGFSHVLYHHDMRVYPHNLFLEVFCEIGFIGLLLLFMHLWPIARDGFKCYSGRLSQNQRTLLFGLLMAALFYLIAAQFSGDLNDNRRLWFFLGLLVAFISMCRNQLGLLDKE